MNFTAFFSDKGVPETGLTPTITIYELDGTPVVSAQNMTEIAGGWYYYDYVGYDEDEEYVSVADGGATLKNNDRYVYGGTQVDFNIVNARQLIQGADDDDLKDLSDALDLTALEANVQGHVVTALGTYTAPTKAELDAAETNIITEVNANETKIDAIIAAIALLPSAADIWAYTTKTLTSFGTLVADITTAVWVAGTRTLTSFGTLVTDIWAAGTRTLTSFGTLIADIWSYATRTLTSFGTLVTDIDTQLSATHGAGDWSSADVDFIKDIEGGRWKIDSTLNQMIFYKPDNVTEIARFNLLDSSGNPAVENVFERVRITTTTTTTSTTTTTTS